MNWQNEFNDTRGDRPPIEKVVERIAEVTGRRPTSTSGGGYAACCPAHSDQNPSLSVDEGEDGRVLLYCHAGCDTGAILSSLGLTARDLFPDTDVHDGNDQPVFRYVDEDGSLLYEVVRFPGKEFRHRRPDPAGGGYTYNMKGTRRVPYRLPEVIGAINSGKTIFIPEGERDVERLRQEGLVATTNSGGSNGWRNEFGPMFMAAEVVILPDNDEAGVKHAEDIHRSVAPYAAKIRVVVPPGLGPGGDISDWLNNGGTKEQLLALVEQCPALAPPFQPSDDMEPPKPMIRLPGGSRGITDTAIELAQLIAPTRRLFNRGESVVRLVSDSKGYPILEALRPSMLASEIEAVAQPTKLDRKGQVVDAVCTEQQAKLILNARAFAENLPQIKVLSRCPLLVPSANGELRQVTGYDEETGVYASGDAVPDMDLPQAVALIDNLLIDFHFATGGDKARAVAAILTPALVLGGILSGRAPLDLGEADDSQTGKGFRNKLTAAIYRHTVFTVTQRKAGVGSLEESFNRALVSGASFICLDNCRGAIDSPAIESFMTEDVYVARALRCEAIVDPARTVVMVTSNRADITKDLANRASCTRILKQPNDYAFRKYPEGDILDHIRENQAQYLAAVFSVIRGWWNTGHLRTNESRHSFKVWVQSLDWIVRGTFGLAPLMDGHGEAQQRMTTPSLNWLRDLALAIKHRDRLNEWLRTKHIVEIALDDAEVDVPGLKDGQDPSDDDVRSKIHQAFGRRLKRCFGDKSRVVIDNLIIDRQRVSVERMDGIGGPVETPEYWFFERPDSDESQRQPDQALELPHEGTDAAEHTGVA